MANEQHLVYLRLSILGQGPEVWNEWRKENPDIFPELSGADLKGCFFKSFNFTKTNLNEANLTKADLSNSNLTEANLTKANLEHTFVQEGIYLQANFEKGNLSEAYFSNNCNLSEASFKLANLYCTALAQKLMKL